MFLVINLVNLLLIQIFVSINEDGFSQEVFKLVEFINPLAYTVVPEATGLAGRLNTQSSARRLRHRCRLPELGFKLVSLGASCVILNGKPMG